MMAEADGGNGSGNGGANISFQWGNKSVTARGLSAIYVVVAFIGILTVGYTNYRVEMAIRESDAENHRLFQVTLGRLADSRTEQRVEHEKLRRAANLNACIALFDFNERKQLRGKNVRDLIRDCPFLEES